MKNIVCFLLLIIPVCYTAAQSSVQSRFEKIVTDSLVARAKPDKRHEPLKFEDFALRVEVWEAPDSRLFTVYEIPLIENYSKTFTQEQVLRHLENYLNERHLIEIGSVKKELIRNWSYSIWYRYNIHYTDGVIVTMLSNWEAKEGETKLHEGYYKSLRQTEPTYRNIPRNPGIPR